MGSFLRVFAWVNCEFIIDDLFFFLEFSIMSAMDMPTSWERRASHDKYILPDEPGPPRPNFSSQCAAVVCLLPLLHILLIGFVWSSQTCLGEKLMKRLLRIDANKCRAGIRGHAHPNWVLNGSRVKTGEFFNARSKFAKLDCQSMIFCLRRKGSAVVGCVFGISNDSDVTVPKPLPPPCWDWAGDATRVRGWDCHPSALPH